MAKPNVHTASRDELRDAGVRADVIDEIVKRRRRKGGITLASLDEVQGVGPATLEQLGQALDFTEPPSEEAKTNGEPQPPQGRPANGDRRGGSDDQAASKASGAGRAGHRRSRGHPPRRHRAGGRSRGRHRAGGAEATAAAEAAPRGRGVGAVRRSRRARRPASGGAGDRGSRGRAG